MRAGPFKKNARFEAALPRARANEGPDAHHFAAATRGVSKQNSRACEVFGATAKKRAYKRVRDQREATQNVAIEIGKNRMGAFLWPGHRLSAVGGGAIRMAVFVPAEAGLR